MNKLALTALTATLSLGLIGCGQDAKPQKDAKADAKKDAKADAKKEVKEEEPKAVDPAQLTRSIIDAWNKGDDDGALANASDDIEWEYVGMPEVIKGKDGVKKQWATFRGAFPDTKMTLKQVFASGDTLALHLVANGTHKGDFNGIAATDKPIGFEFMLLVDQKDGKAVKWTEYAHMGAIPSQVGAGPEGAPPVPLAEAPTGAPNVITGEPNEANEKIVKEWYGAFESGDADAMLAAIDKYLAPDGVHHQVAQGETKEGIESAKKELPTMSKMFENVKIEYERTLSAGDYVLTVGTWSGKHIGDMGPIKASNKEFKVDFAEIAQVVDGKIKNSWSYENPMQFLTQIGAVEMPAPPEEVAQK